MNKITLFVFAVIYFEVAYSLRTYSIKKSNSKAENIFATLADTKDTGVVPSTKSRKPIAKTPSLSPSPKSKKSIVQPQPVSPKNTPLTTDSQKKDIDEKILFITLDKIVEGKSNGEIKIDGVLAYVDERLKQGLLRLENIDGDLYANGNVIMKKNPSKPEIRIGQLKIDTDQVKQFKIEIITNGNFNNIGINNSGSFNFNGVTINGGNIIGNGSGGDKYYCVRYEDNINGNMIFI